MHTPSQTRSACLALVALPLLIGCSFHSTATHWNGRMGPDGVPVFVKATTNVGLNVLIGVPLLGKTSIDTMLDETTAQIETAGSDRVRVIETASENYWHGFPPFTWILTPVITNVSVEYRPSATEIALAAKDDPKLAEATKENRADDKGR